MDSLVHADIFFFVTTIAVVVVALFAVVALVYFIKVLRHLKEIAEEIKEETLFVRRDIGEARAQMKLEGFKIKQIIDFFSRLVGRRKIKKSRKI